MDGALENPVQIQFPRGVDAGELGGRLLDYVAQKTGYEISTSLADFRVSRTNTRSGIGVEKKVSFTSLKGVIYTPTMTEGFSPPVSMFFSSELEGGCFRKLELVPPPNIKELPEGYREFMGIIRDVIGSYFERGSTPVLGNLIEDKEGPSTFTHDFPVKMGKREFRRFRLELAETLKCDFPYEAGLIENVIWGDKGPVLRSSRQTGGFGYIRRLEGEVENAIRFSAKTKKGKVASWQVILDPNSPEQLNLYREVETFIGQHFSESTNNL